MSVVQQLEQSREALLSVAETLSAKGKPGIWLVLVLLGCPDRAHFRPGFRARGGPAVLSPLQLARGSLLHCGAAATPGSYGLHMLWARCEILTSLHFYTSFCIRVCILIVKQPQRHQLRQKSNLTDSNRISVRQRTMDATCRLKRTPSYQNLFFSHAISVQLGPPTWCRGKPPSCALHFFSRQLPQRYKEGLHRVCLIVIHCDEIFIMN